MGQSGNQEKKKHAQEINKCIKTESGQNDIFEEKGNHHQHQTWIARKTQSRKQEKNMKW